MARSSTRWRKPRSRSRAGAGTTTPAARTRPWATGHRLQKWSCGRLDQPPGPWLQSRSCTNIQPGPPDGGRPVGHDDADFVVTLINEATLRVRVRHEEFERLQSATVQVISDPLIASRSIFIVFARKKSKLNSQKKT